MKEKGNSRLFFIWLYSAAKLKTSIKNMPAGGKTKHKIVLSSNILFLIK
ncbi:hypothetical protein [Weizmannia acidilactici]|nr:hypothetical protein [Weizmannia acidilactici]